MRDTRHHRLDSMNDREFTVFKNGIISAFLYLDINQLNKVDFNLTYNDEPFEFLYQAVDYKINELKKLGILSLSYKKETCLHCFQGMDRYTFFNPSNGEDLISYVIGLSGNSLIVQECRNRPINTDPNGMPF